MMKKTNLNYFGDVLMKNVRDEAIDDWERILNGQMNDTESKEIFSKLNYLNIKEKQFLNDLFSKVVDTTLHHLLWTVEQDEFIDIVVSKDGREEKVINQISDGLAGELYTEDGWVYQFSNKKKFL